MSAMSYGADSSWTETTAWWLDPRLAYAAGLIHGAQLERERLEAEDEAAHRVASRRAFATIEAADARAQADAGRAG
jgi:hypothetical protein